MASLTSIEIYNSPRLAGFWQYAADGGFFLGLFERGEDGNDGLLSIGRFIDGRLQPRRTIASPGFEVRAIEACQSGTDLIVVSEINRDRAGEIARISLDALFEDANAHHELRPVGDLRLSASQIAAIRLPVGDRWSVAGPLAPVKWIFSPRPVQGGNGEVIANTADGQIVFLGPSHHDTSGFTRSDAAEPQAWRYTGKLAIAFLRQGRPYRPFWSQRLYSGSGQATGGTLHVLVDRSETNLSAALGIGEVTAFAVAEGPGGDEWLFALGRAHAKDSLFAITRTKGNGGWELRKTWFLDCAANRLSAVYQGQQWHIVFASKTNSGWSLRHISQSI
jgi:hypothetical protein